MPNDKPAPHPNGHKPPESLNFESGPLTCWNCNRNFDHFVVETTNEFTQLRCGNALVASIKIACTHCGRVFSWDMNTKKLEAMAVKYGEFVAVMKRYNPE